MKKSQDFDVKYVIEMHGESFGPYIWIAIIWMDGESGQVGIINSFGRNPN